MDLIHSALGFLNQLVDQQWLADQAQAMGPWFYVFLFAIVFCETGLVVTPFLPGDSLLFAVGALAPAAGSGLSMPVLLMLLIAAAVLGDAVNYAIGYRLGPKVFKYEQSRLFNKKHLLRTQAFYEKYGGKTIILARFMPILRTFAPVVAGVGRMDYRKFLFYNVFGGVGWVGSMLLLGYSLTPVLDPLLKPIFGEGVRVQDHVEKVILIVVFLSISPGLVHWLRGKLRGKPKAEPALAEAGD